MLSREKIEAITQSHDMEGFVLVHVGTNNAEREGTTAIVKKYRQLGLRTITICIIYK